MSTKPKHTPGPWSVLIHGSCNDLTYKVVNSHARLASHEKALANARLIAAAPEMLGALEAALPVLRLNKKNATADIVEAAIAKARGEP